MKVKDICDLHNGRAFKPGDWGSEGLPIIRIQNLNDEKAPFNYFSGEHSPVHEINDGDLLFSWSGTPGTSFGAFRWRRGKGVLNQHIFKILPKIEVDKEYLKYALNGNINTIIAKAHGGVGLQHITKKELDEIDIPIIALPDQLKAVDRISSAEKMIAMRKLELQKLDELVKARFVEMFGDLVIGNKVGTNKKRIGEIASVTKLAGFEFTKYIQYKEHGDIIMLRGLNCKKGHLILDDIKWIDKETSDLLPRSKLHYGDILMTYAGTIGDIAMVDANDKYHLAPNVAKITVNDMNAYNPVFLMHLFMYTNDYIMTFASVVAQASINMEKIRGFEYYFPPIEKQNEFAAFVEQTDKSKAAIQKAMDEAQLLFDSLMQKYFG